MTSTPEIGWSSTRYEWTMDQIERMEKMYLANNFSRYVLSNCVEMCFSDSSFWPDYSPVKRVYMIVQVFEAFRYAIEKHGDIKKSEYHRPAIRPSADQFRKVFPEVACG